MNMIRNAFLDYLSNKQARRDSPYQIRVGLCVRQVQNGVAKYYFTHNGFLEYLRTKKINFDYNMLRASILHLEQSLLYGGHLAAPSWGADVGIFTGRYDRCDSVAVFSPSDEVFASHVFIVLKRVVHRVSMFILQK